MAYEPQLEEGEKLALQIVFKISEKTKPFNFAVSDQALYWPAIKTFAMNDATYFKRIRNGQISEVCVRRLPPYGLWAAALLMFLVGLETMYVMFAPLVNHALGEHRVSGWPFALVAGGVLMPFATKGRLGLEIRTQDKTFRWKPPLVVDKASKRKIQETFDQILAACEKSGLRTSRP